jgi:uncharacterized protein YcbX
MAVEIGRIEAIFRYPVKSMRGEPLDSATLGWHGLDGDRRLAFRRLDERGGFPWLSATLILRCAMVNLDPDDGSSAPDVMKAVVRANENTAGIYGTVTRIGRVAVGQSVVLHR